MDVYSSVYSELHLFFSILFYYYRHQKNYLLLLEITDCNLSRKVFKKKLRIQKSNVANYEKYLRGFEKSGLFDGE